MDYIKKMKTLSKANTHLLRHEHLALSTNNGLYQLGHALSHFKTYILKQKIKHEN